MLLCSYKALLEETVTQGHRAAAGQVSASKEVNSGEEEGPTDVDQLQLRGILRGSAACDSYYATHNHLISLIHYPAAGTEEC